LDVKAVGTIDADITELTISLSVYRMEAARSEAKKVLTPQRLRAVDCIRDHAFSF